MNRAVDPGSIPGVSTTVRSFSTQRAPRHARHAVQTFEHPVHSFAMVLRWLPHAQAESIRFGAEKGAIMATHPHTEPVRESRSASVLWGSGFGRAATRSVQILAVLAVVAIVVALTVQLSVVVTPALLALIVASAIHPAIAWLHSHGVHRMLATWIALLSIILILALIIWLIVLAVINQWDDLVTATNDGLGSLQSFLSNQSFADQLPTPDQITGWFTDVLSTSGFQSGALAGLSATASFLTGFGIFVVVLFFFLKDGPQIWEFLLRPFHGEAYERGLRVGRATTTTFGGYLRGTSIVAAADAVGIGVGLAILQVPLALPLAVIVFITSFIPIVGATLAGIVAALVALVANGPVAALIVIGIVVGVNQIEGNLLQPIVMGRTLKLHPLVILIALTLGASLGGVLGAIIAVPLTAAAWSVLQVWDGPDLPALPVRRKEHEVVLAADDPDSDEELPEV